MDSRIHLWNSLSSNQHDIIERLYGSKETFIESKPKDFESWILRYTPEDARIYVDHFKMKVPLFVDRDQYIVKSLYRYGNEYLSDEQMINELDLTPFYRNREELESAFINFPKEGGFFLPPIADFDIGFKFASGQCSWFTLAQLQMNITGHKELKGQK